MIVQASAEPLPDLIASFDSFKKRKAVLTLSLSRSLSHHICIYIHMYAIIHDTNMSTLACS